MDADDGTSLPVPRLRLSRHYSPSAYSDDNTPVAGPSRLSPNALFIPTFNSRDEDEDTQSTPRMTVGGSILRDMDPPSFQPSSPGDTPAARLRAVLARVPTTHAGPSKLSKPRSPEPGTPSEFDSDFDVPNSMSVAPSFAQESLKELFSRALRDTPQKGRRRRNSIDASEVEQSPRIDRIARERATGKAKRKSLSDDELEKFNKSQDPPPKFSLRASPKTSPASTYDTLRERLNNSQIRILDMRSSASSSRHSSGDVATDSSTDTATLLQQLGSSTSAPPAATSTPHRVHPSLQMPSHLQSQSNLLENDSDMNKLMGLESYDTDSAAPMPFPSTEPTTFPNGAVSTPARRISLPHSNTSPLTMIGKRSSLSRIRHTSFDTPMNVPQGSSPQSDRVHNQDHGWNKPEIRTPNRSGTPELSHSLTAAHLARHNGLPRRGSNASLLSNVSLDDGASVRSRTMSLASDAESTHSRERGWNQPNPILRPGEPRARTTSQPLMPGSPGSPWAPRPGLQARTSSAASVSSRSSSRASMHESDSHSPVVHERERNWNSPQPKWSHQSPHGRNSVSPNGSPSPLHSRVGMRSRAESLQASPTIEEGPSTRERFGSTGKRTPLRHALSSPAVGTTSPAGSPSRVPVRASRLSISPLQSDRRSSTFPVRTGTPDLSDGLPGANGLRRSPGDASRLSSRFGWQFPRNKTVLPPFETDSSFDRPTRTRAPSNDSLRTEDEDEELVPTRPTTPTDANRPTTPGSRPSSRASLSVDVPRSRIPTLSLRNNGDVSPNSPRGARGHKRTSAEFSTAVGGLPPRVQRINEEYTAAAVNDIPEEDELMASDEEDASTPEVAHASFSNLASRISSPSSQRMSPSILPQMSYAHDDEDRVQNVALSPPVPPLPDSPPATQVVLPSPPADSPDSPLSPVLPTTPPRRSSFITSRIEFQTPSPPKGMPDLPGPPSSDDDNTHEFPLQTPKQNGIVRENGLDRPDLSSMKTPKPPGAWAATPVPSAHFEPPREPSMDWAGGSVSSDRFNPQAVSSPATTAQATPMFSVDSSDASVGGLITPAPSFSRAGPSAAPTPAPPGAWLPTPGSARKSIYKVRFDVSESEMSATEESQALGNGEMLASHTPLQAEDTNRPTKAEIGVSEFQSTEAATINAPPLAERVNVEEGLVHPEMPELGSQMVRKTHVVRLLDAFGREQQEPEASPEPDFANADESTPHTEKVKEDPNGTPRSRTSMRMLDAMGREVEEDVMPEPESPTMLSLSEDDAPQTRAEALAIIRKNTIELQRELDEYSESASDVLAIDHRAYAKLEAIVDESRAHREQLQGHLATVVKSTEAADREYRTTKVRRDLHWNAAPKRMFINLLNPRVLCTLVALQLLLAITFYRFANARAEGIFRTRYYDPFNPDIYLYTIKPDLLRRSITTSTYAPSLSLSAIPVSVRRQGWTGALMEVGSNASALLADWQRSTWETWSTRTGGTVTTWPPT